MTLYELGLINPIAPIAPYEASDVQTAFRHIQQGKHIGKIVVRMPEAQKHDQVLSIKRQPTALNIDCNSAYLLVGGMGGLGRVVSSWLVEHGARHLIFMSRSAGQGDADKEFANELASQGCTVQMLSGSISSMEDVSRVVAEASVPTKGILNLSMVLQVSPSTPPLREFHKIVICCANPYLSRTEHSWK